MSWRQCCWLVVCVLAGSPALPQNLLVNGSFATDLSGWTTSPGGGNISWTPLDAGGSASSGSVRLVTPSFEGETVNSLRQCVPVTPGTDYTVSAKAFVAFGIVASAFVTIDWFEDDACVTFLESSPIALSFFFAPGDETWRQMSDVATAHPAASSARVVLQARRESAGATAVRFDDVVFASDLGCVDDATTLCLSDGRFRLTSVWRTSAGQTGDGQAVRLTGDTGYFWFFNDDNVEIVLKVLDACTTPFESFWVFAAGLTNVEVEIRIEDTEAEIEKTYFNPLDRPFEPIQDTAAFLTCH